jgi:hypothetical protein
LASDEVLISKPPPSNAEPMKRLVGEVATPLKYPTKKVVATRTNWGKGGPLERITQRPSRSGMMRLADTGTPMERPVHCECSRLWSASLMTHSRSMLPPVLPETWETQQEGLHNQSRTRGLLLILLQGMIMEMTC